MAKKKDGKLSKKEIKAAKKATKAGKSTKKDGAKGSKPVETKKKSKKKQEDFDDEEIDEDEAFNEMDEDRYGDVLNAIKERMGADDFEFELGSDEDEDLVDEDEDMGLQLSNLIKDPSAYSEPTSKTTKKKKVEEDSDSEDEAEFDADALIASLDQEEEIPQAKRVEIGQVGVETDAGLSLDLGISTDDILASLEDSTDFGELKTQLAGIKSEAALKNHGGDVKTAREERKVRYEVSSKDVSKWIPQVQQNRQAEQIVLGAPTQKLQDPAALVTSFEASNDFEREVEEAIKASGLTQEKITDASALPMEENLAKERQRQQVAQLKHLMMREAVRSKRLSKIKSKTWHKIKNKAEKRNQEKLLERLEIENPEMAKKLKEEYGQKYAKMRLMRQQAARKKWSVAANRFGGKDIRQAISEQANKMNDEKKALERMVKGRSKAGESDDESDVEDIDVSDDEVGQGAEVNIQKAKLATLRELANVDEAEKEDSLPKTGLFGMKFMREGIMRQREEAKESAKQLLKELSAMDPENLPDSDSEDEKAKKKKRKQKEGVQTQPKFSPEELAEAALEAAEIDVEDGLCAAAHEKVDVRAGGELTVKNKKVAEKLKKSAVASAEVCKKFKPEKKTAAPACDASNPWVSNWAGSTEWDAAAADEKNPWLEDKNAKPKKKVVKEESEDEDDDNIFADIDDHTSSQQDIIQQAFAKSNLREEDFLEDITTKEEKEAAKDEDLSGWGSWAGEGIKPKRKKEPIRDEVAEARAKRQRKLVTFNEQLDKKAAKYVIASTPTEFGTAAQYESTLKAPLGPEWNTSETHKRMIQPKVITRLGAVVAPLQFHKQLNNAQKDSLIGAWSNKPKVQRTKARF